MQTYELVVRSLSDKVKQKLEQDKGKPLKVSIMGQTGVGKSSLINALFNTTMRKVDAVHSCTGTTDEPITLKGTGDGKLLLYDLPGIGESKKTDEEYLALYREKMEDSDIILWAIHADSRSFTFDQDALQILFESLDDKKRARLINRITFILTKADLLMPSPWVLAKVGNEGIFVPKEDTEKLLEQKEEHCQRAFILPYRDLLTSQTFHDGTFTIEAPHLRYDRNIVYYTGFMEEETLLSLKGRFPEYGEVFDRLYDNYNVISCSSRYRFNLDLLMRVILNKLGSEAVARFSAFSSGASLNRLVFAEARGLANFIILDQDRKCVLYDATRGDESTGD